MTIPLSALVNACAAMKKALQDPNVSGQLFNTLNEAHSQLAWRVREMQEQQTVEVVEA